MDPQMLMWLMQMMGGGGGGFGGPFGGGGGGWNSWSPFGGMGFGDMGMGSPSAAGHIISGIDPTWRPGGWQASWEQPFPNMAPGNIPGGPQGGQDPAYATWLAANPQYAASLGGGGGKNPWVYGTALNPNIFQGIEGVPSGTFRPDIQLPTGYSWRQTRGGWAPVASQEGISPMPTGGYGNYFWNPASRKWESGTRDPALANVPRYLRQRGSDLFDPYANMYPTWMGNDPFGGGGGFGNMGWNMGGGGFGGGFGGGPFGGGGGGGDMWSMLMQMLGGGGGFGGGF